MSIVFGFGMSHAPPVHQHRDAMYRWYRRTVEKNRTNGWLVPASAEDMTPEAIDEYWLRTRRSFAEIKRDLEAIQPEALVIFGGSGGNQFIADRPSAVTVFTGAEAYGFTSGDASPLSTAALAGKTPGEADYVHLKTDVALARRIFEGLQQRGFDVAAADEFRPNGPAMLQDDWANPTEVFPPPDLPVVIVAMRYNGFEDNRAGTMQVSGELAYNLGRAVAEIVQTDPKRIAICGSGGLSHDPNGPRNMWIDTPLDEWVLEQVTAGSGQALTNLFEFDSMTMRAGTREIAAWIAATGAMEYIRAPARVLDYIGDAPQFQGGIGYALWEPSASAAAKA